MSDLYRYSTKIYRLTVVTISRGEPGEEVVDGNFNFTNARRRSNSSTLTTDIKNFKTKFDVNEQEPVFEEHLHGPAEEEDEELHKTGSTSGDSTASGTSL